MGVFGIDPDKRVDVPNGLRRTGVTGGKGIFDKYMNQILFELKANQIWGTESQVKAVPPEATFYTDGSGNPLDKLDAAVTINEDDKILIAHDVTATANHVLDCGGKKVILEMAQGVTWNLDTFDLTLGGTGDSIGGSIRIIQTGSLTISSNRGLSINESVDTYSDFVTKNLIINVQSNTTVDADADNIVFVDEFGGGKRVDNINETFDVTTDLMSGTSEKASTWYQMWLDSEGVRLLVPDLESLTDGTTANKLVDSGATFQTDKVQIGDEIRNRTDGTATIVTGIDSETVLSISDDIFVSGEDYEIHLLSPTGLGEFKANIGKVFNNSGSDFDNIKKNGKARITQSRWHTVNGRGSISTAIPKWSVEVEKSNDVVATIVNSATLGLTITANMDCNLSVRYNNHQSTSDQAQGLSLNSTELTTGIIGLIIGDRIAMGHNVGIDEGAQISISDFEIKKGDAVRPHTNTGADGGTPSRSSIIVTAIEII